MGTQANTNRRLRLGMVGGGEGAFIGAVHRIAARMDDRYDLVAGALSADPERARSSAAGLHISEDRAYADFQAMARAEAERDDGIDVVAIVTPNHLHFPIAKAFLEAGIHVVCDKPMTTSLADAQALAEIVASSGLVFALTHNYTGHPMVRQAREMVRGGDLGAIRVVQAEYPQGWLATNLETTGHKQAEWRTDPGRSGPAGCLGDIGTHAYNLLRFVTGLEPSEIAADLHTFVAGRALDDNAHIMLRFDGGARGMIWSSQVAPGNENALRIRIYGEEAGLAWEQENPNHLLHTPRDDAPRLITRGGPAAGEAAAAATSVPAGHPEGYLEAFAQLYSEVAEQITAHREGREPDSSSLLVPTVQDGVDGVRFIERAVDSSRHGGTWVAF